MEHNSKKPVSLSIDVLDHDSSVSMVNMRRSNPNREWGGYIGTAEKVWRQTSNGVRYRRFGLMAEGWGALPYGGIVFRRDAAFDVGPFNMASDPDRTENHFSRKMGSMYASALIQLQDCDEDITLDVHGDVAGGDAAHRCTEKMGKAFQHIGVRRSSGWRLTKPDYVQWNDLPQGTPVNPPMDDPVFRYERHSSVAGNPLLVQNSCDPDYDIKIFVYTLPDRFWKDLMDTHQKSCERGKRCFSHSCKTGPFSLESRLHEYLLESSFRTQNPEEAHAFYVPMYAVCQLMLPGNEDVMEDYEQARIIVDIVQELRSFGPYFDRNAGADHIWPFPRDFGAHNAMMALMQGTRKSAENTMDGPPINYEIGLLVRNGIFVGHFGSTPRK
jgi:Exostosin family